MPPFIGGFVFLGVFKKKGSEYRCLSKFL